MVLANVVIFSLKFADPPTYNGGATITNYNVQMKKLDEQGTVFLFFSSPLPFYFLLMVQKMAWDQFRNNGVYNHATFNKTTKRIVK